MSAYERRFSEKRVVPFTREQLYDVVADVDNYKEFVPWCTASRVTTRVDDMHIIADLSVGFKYLSESYTSVISMKRPNYIKVDVPTSSLFEFLINDWEFSAHDDEKSTLLSFSLKFAFRNRIYQQATNLFFDDVVRQMVSAFENRCHAVYNNKTINNSTFALGKDDDDDKRRRPGSSGTMHKW